MSNYPRHLTSERHVASFSALLSSKYRIYGLSLLLAVPLLAGLPLYYLVSAAIGDLDPTFGTGGKVTTTFPAGPGSATALALQSDGKIVAGGQINSPRGSFSGETFGLARYNTDGSLDAGFGSGGRVITPGLTELTSILIQSDGKIVAGGDEYDISGTTPAFALARYNSNGALDATFGSGGIATTSFFGKGDKVNALVLQADGRMVAVGNANNGSKSLFAMARYNTDGSLDPAFGSSGKTTVDFGSTNEFANAAALQLDGKIVAAGYDTTSGTNTDFALARLKTDGTLDASFGTGGKVTTDILNGDHANGVAIQGDGKIVAAGDGNVQFDINTGNETSQDFAVARYNANGTLDTSFGSGGKITTDFGSLDTAHAIAIQPDGNIVAVGQSADGSPSDNGESYALARYTTNGTLETNFGTGGKVLTTFPPLSFSLFTGFAVAIQPDGKILTSGYSNANFDAEFGLLRYGPNGSLDSSFGSGGRVATDFLLHDAAANVLLLQPNGKIVAVGGSYDFEVPFLAHIYLARYNQDGSLDPAFGTAGKEVTDFISGDTNNAGAAVLQPDGKILVGGSVGPHSSSAIDVFDSDFALARYNSDGSLDATFGTGGVVTQHFAAERAAGISRVVLQADGKIVVGGTSEKESGDFISHFDLIRYNSNGTVDTTFGSNGQVSTPAGSFLGNPEGVLLVIQPDGKLDAGFFKPPSSDGGFTIELARYNTDGSLDGSFGTGGTVTVEFTRGISTTTGSFLLLRPDGRLLVGATIFTNTTVADKLAQYNSNGSVDTTFGTNGVATAPFTGQFNFNSAALQSDGKIVVAGYDFNPPQVSVFAVARFNSDGTLDSSFGTNGQVPTTFFTYPLTSAGRNFVLPNVADSVIIQPDGNIVAGGAADSGISNDFALARYIGSAAATPSPSPTPTPSPSPSPSPSTTTVQFSSATYSTPEMYGSITVTVTRSGDTTGTSTVNYAVNDASATQRSDFTFAAGSLTFNAGDTTQSFPILINRDSFQDGTEQASITLGTITNGVAGSPSAATLAITDANLQPNPPNIIDDPRSFVYQHYHDFLDREPDQDGLNFWTGQITSCGSDSACIHHARIGVSAAFFIEQEFQQTGFFVYSLYKAGLGARVTYVPFMIDRGKVIGGTSLGASKSAYAREFVQRSAFTGLYPATQGRDAFIDALLKTVQSSSGVDLTSHRADLQAEYDKTSDQTSSRAAVLTKLVGLAEYMSAEFNRGFVLAEYFGYLRRDVDENGYTFWLNVLNNRDPGNFRGMVCSFITSAEYQNRFSTVVTRSNRDCSQP